LRTSKQEILDLNDLSLLGTGQEHEAIIWLRWHCGIISLRSAEQQRRQS